MLFKLHFKARTFLQKVEFTHSTFLLYIELGMEREERVENKRGERNGRGARQVGEWEGTFPTEGECAGVIYIGRLGSARLWSRHLACMNSFIHTAIL